MSILAVVLDVYFSNDVLFFEGGKVFTHLANGIAGLSLPSRAFKAPLLGNLNASVKCPSVHAEGRGDSTQTVQRFQASSLLSLNAIYRRDTDNVNKFPLVGV